MIDLNLPDPGILALPEGRLIIITNNINDSIIIKGGYAVVATSDHANEGLTESAFPLHGSDDLVNWQPQVRSL